MKRHLFILLFALFAGVSSAQEVKPVKDPLFIKYNLTRQITGETTISIEKFFNKVHPELSVGIIYPFKPWINGVKDNALISDVKASHFYGRGYDFSLQNKFIIEKITNKSSGYFSPLIMFKHVQMDSTWIDYTSKGLYGNKYYWSSLESDKTNVLAIELLIGYEKYFLKKWMLDFYLGTGWRWITRYDHYEYDQSDYLNFVPHKERDYSHGTMTLHFGINIGYNLH